MNNAQRYLCLVMRIIAAVSACAIMPVFMPHAWMDAIHRQLGLGQLPDMPVIEYLTRSVSVLYTLHAVVFWIAAGDVVRFRPIIGAIIAWFLAFGVLILGIDVAAGVPWFWIAGEGPVVLVLGVVMLVLFLKCPAAPHEPTGPK